MPYIVRERRDEIVKEYQKPQTPGELNYAFTEFANMYLRRAGLNYQTINDIMGAFEGAKAEFYRRIASPYEDKKIKENGDVYEL